MAIEVMELGIVIDVMLEQPSNAWLPIFVTVLGIVVFLHPEKIIFVAVTIIALQLSLESYFGLPFSTTNEVKLGQFLKGVPSKLVTELGIVTEVKLLQPKKALRPIDVTVLGMSTDVIPVQS